VYSVSQTPETHRFRKHAPKIIPPYVLKRHRADKYESVEHESPEIRHAREIERRREGCKRISVKNLVNAE
jgi:hypothetical protein